MSVEGEAKPASRPAQPTREADPGGQSVGVGPASMGDRRGRPSRHNSPIPKGTNLVDKHGRGGKAQRLYDHDNGLSDNEMDTEESRHIEMVT